MQHLQIGATLQGGKYRIEAIIGEGGFGNTYRGTNTEFNEQIAIKEFFMRGVTERDDTTSNVSVSNVTNTDSFQQQKEKFKKEARRLRQFDNPYIVRVHDLFEENGTAYYIMDYIDGESLSDRMKRIGCPLTEEEVRRYLPQILAALKNMHDEGLWHLDLKPGNIMVDRNDNVKLIDFGASKQVDAQAGGAKTKTAVAYTSGFAPREQVEMNYEDLGPWTDIYALGATLYALLTNHKPPVPAKIDDDESADKHAALPFPYGVSAAMRSLVLSMMNTNRKRRPQSVDALMAILQGGKDNSTRESLSETTIGGASLSDEEDEATRISVRPTTGKETSPPPKNNTDNSDRDGKNLEKTKNNNMKIVIAIIGVVAVLVVVFLFLFKGGGVAKDNVTVDSTKVAVQDSTTLQQPRDDNEIRYALMSLRDIANEMNASCPMADPEKPGKTVTSVKLKDDAYLTYKIECDVKVMGVEEINRDEYKANIINGLKSNPDIVKNMKVANVGVLYHYYNSDDETDCVQITVDAKEL